MEKFSVTANMKREVVERVRKFQDKNGIKLFADAFEAYVDELESVALPRLASKR